MLFLVISLVVLWNGFDESSLSEEGSAIKIGKDSFVGWYVGGRGEVC